MKHYLKFIKKFHLLLLAFALVALVYFGVTGVRAELKKQEDKNQGITVLTPRPLNIVAVDNVQAQNIVSSSPSRSPETEETFRTPEVKNIPASDIKSSPKARVTMRINAGSAAGNYPVDYLSVENAYQLLLRIADLNNFKVSAKDYGWGIYVEGIGNLIQDGHDNFWFFYINGKLSEVGAADYQVKPEDLIEWRYHEWWIY